MQFRKRYGWITIDDLHQRRRHNPPVPAADHTLAAYRPAMRGTGRRDAVVVDGECVCFLFALRRVCHRNRSTVVVVMVMVVLLYHAWVSNTTIITEISRILV